MTLSSISSAASLYSTNAISSRVAEALAKPQERLSQQAESTRVQLSAFGQVKSATAELEGAAKKLQDDKLGVDSLTKAVQGFADAYNNRLATTGKLSGGNAGNASQAVLAGDGKVRAAANETRRTLEGINGSNRQALQQIGVSFAANGSLKVDTQALKNAFNANPDQLRETLNTVGKQVAEQSAKQLTGTGAVGASIDKLNEQLGNIEQRQAVTQTLAEQSRQTVQDQDKQFAQLQQVAQLGFMFSGAAAYNRIFSN